LSWLYFVGPTRLVLWEASVGVTRRGPRGEAWTSLHSTVVAPRFPSSCANIRDGAPTPPRTRAPHSHRHCANTAKTEASQCRHPTFPECACSPVIFDALCTHARTRSSCTAVASRHCFKSRRARAMPLSQSEKDAQMMRGVGLMCVAGVGMGLCGYPRTAISPRSTAAGWSAFSSPSCGWFVRSSNGSRQRKPMALLLRVMWMLTGRWDRWATRGKLLHGNQAKRRSERSGTCWAVGAVKSHIEYRASSPVFSFFVIFARIRGLDSTHTVSQFSDLTRDHRSCTSPRVSPRDA
jgi:hypothetical protein